MSEWFDILKQRGKKQGTLDVGLPPAQPANPQTRRPPTAEERQQYQQRQRRLNRRQGPPTAAEKQRMQQRKPTPQQAVQGMAGAMTVDLSPEQGNRLHAQAKENPHPQFRNLSREEVTYLQQSGMNPAQIRNINNQASSQNQVAFGAAGQSLGRRAAAGAGNLALRGVKGGLGALRSAAGYGKQRLGQMVTPSPNQPRGAQTNVPSPTQANVAARPDPQVIQDLNNQIQQMKVEVAGNPAARPRLEALEAQLQAEQNKGKLHGREIIRPVAGTPPAGTRTGPPPANPPPANSQQKQPFTKSEWFNVLYSHQTM
tara:strand:- start:1481 stop:2419 length:939 start_codon:yes stop_codon:yes gene_type:complete